MVLPDEVGSIDIEVDPSMLASTSARTAQSVPPSQGRCALLEGLARYNARDTPDKFRITFKPNPLSCDFRSWLQGTCDVRGRQMWHVMPPLLLVVLEAVAVAVLHDPRVMPDRSWGRGGHWVSREDYSMFTVPISVLLLFRLNRAAIRYYDARGAFGRLIEVARTLAGEAVQYLGHDPRARDEVCRWLVAFPVAARNYLRGEAPDEREAFEGVLTETEALAMRAAPNQTLLCQDRMRRAVHAATRGNSSDSAPVAAHKLAVLEGNLALLNATVALAENINNTPLPFTFVAHLRHLLLWYLLGMPWALQQSLGWLTPVVVAFIAWALLGIEAAAVACDRPFGMNRNHLPLCTFCKVIGKGVEQILSQEVSEGGFSSAEDIDV